MLDVLYNREFGVAINIAFFCFFDVVFSCGEGGCWRFLVIEPVRFLLDHASCRTALSTFGNRPLMKEI